MRAFIIRPFGTKQGIDFDRVQADLIDPALTAIEIAGRTTGEILQAGNLRPDVFQQLLTADLVLADISIHNATAFYELGIRHALRDRHTFLLRSRDREPLAQKTSDDVPFDLVTDQYLAYDPDDPKSALDALIQGLRSTITDQRVDSPIFLALPELEPPDPSRFAPVPPDFREELERAAKNRHRERLALLAIEVSGFAWETAGLRAVGRKQFDFGFLPDARSTWEAVLERHPDDLEANLVLGTLYQRLGLFDKSNTALKCVLAHPAAGSARLCEAHALLGHNLKHLWQREWKPMPPSERRRKAIESPLLLEAYQEYRKAFLEDLNAFYTGIDALALLSIYLDLAGDARTNSDGLRAEAERLAAAIALAIETPGVRGSDREIRQAITTAQLKLFGSAAAAEVASAWRTALRGAPTFEIEAAVHQLELFRDLGVKEEQVTAVLAAPETTLPAPPAGSVRPDHVLLFTGHRIDSPDRKTPRFPPAGEPKAREAIAGVVKEIRDAATGGLLGVAGAACGGDILFHEVCRELDINTLVSLALPPDQYIRASVLPDWVDRFYRVIGRGEVSVLAEQGNLPAWLLDKPGYDIWQRNNLWELCIALAQDAPRLTLIALWDGQPGDGPGGTEHMLGIARSRGADIRILDTRALFV